ncbi:MAG: DUF3810 family protein [Phycisphaerales bacterium]|nr:DUF3810 family protein [Phycisphaerales bacterium]
MRKRKKLVLSNLLIFAIVLLLDYCSDSTFGLYLQSIFIPLQQLRCGITKFIPFSVGDLIYIIIFVYLLIASIKFLRNYAIRSKQDIFILLLKNIRILLLVYLFLFVLWGIRYVQPKLEKRISLNTIDSVSYADLIAFDSLLIVRMNGLQSQYKTLHFELLNDIASAAYQSEKSTIELSAKASLFASALDYLGIEGYFNPFTGEAQVNKQSPHFMQGFIIAHEMAHQSGIAAEDDANLQAYIICVTSGNTNLQYSAYFNLWLYTHRHVKKIDSTIANSLKSDLNTTSLTQLDSLRQLSLQHHTFLDDWSSYIFDHYLKIGHQPDGIGSYRNVVYAAICWERKKRVLRLQ